MAVQKKSALIWRLAFGLILAALLILGYSVYSSNKQNEAKAIERGKRFIILIRDGQIIAKDGALADQAIVVETPPPKGLETQLNPADTPFPPVETPAEAVLAAPVENHPSEQTAPTTAAPSEAAPVPPTTNEAQPEKPAEQQQAAPAPENKAEAPKAAVPEDKSKPRIAIIVVGLGLSKTSSSEALRLPPEISFSFSPYASNLQEWLKEARAKGHETMLDLPLEPNDYPITDPGPYALISSLSREENSQRLNSLLALSSDYSGIVTQADEKFTASATNLSPLITEMKKRETKLIFSDAVSKNPVVELSDNINFTFWFADSIIDKKLDKEQIEQKLADIEKIALERGYALAISRPYPLSVKTVKDWAAKLEQKGIKLVKVSEIPPGVSK